MLLFTTSVYSINVVDECLSLPLYSYLKGHFISNQKILNIQRIHNLLCSPLELTADGSPMLLRHPPQPPAIVVEDNEGPQEANVVPPVDAGDILTWWIFDVPIVTMLPTMRWFFF